MDPYIYIYISEAIVWLLGHWLAHVPAMAIQRSGAEQWRDGEMEWTSPYRSVAKKQET